VPTRAANPYQGLADADPAGMCWPPRPRTWKFSGAKTRRAGAPSPDLSLVRPPGLEPGQPSRTTAISRPRVYLIPPRAHGAALRCRPGSSAVRRRSRSRARRRELPLVDSNHDYRNQTPASCRWTKRHHSRVRRPGLRTRLAVPRPGFEPRPHGLRVRCSCR
jgi:hypothetical protein